VLDTIEQDNILDNVIQMNKYLVSGLQSITTDKVIEIRSKGLMIAIQLNQDCTELLNAAAKHTPIGTPLPKPFAKVSTSGVRLLY
jgi:acetylornithine aminotransferase